MKKINLRSVRYSPGYCDMRGESHSVTLGQNKDGSWVMECRDRRMHSSPTVVVTYEVAPEAVEEFEAFVIRKRVLSRGTRPKSGLVATEYSPWSYSIDCNKTRFGRTVSDYCRFSEYQKYSGSDRELLKELNSRLMGLKGNKLSETEEE